jgi:trimeric autotransporter adhesin
LGQHLSGPGGGEYYWGDYFNFGGTITPSANPGGNYPGHHPEIVVGGLAVMPGYDQVMAAAYDPGTAIFAGGTITLDNTSGDQVDDYELFVSGDPATSGKGNGIGDLELLCNPAPLEIGNRVWNDTDNDGIQDADESPIANVSLELFADFDNDGTPDGPALGTASTNANGTWYFNAANVTDGDPVTSGNQAGPQPNRRYLIRIGASDWTAGAGTGDLTGFSLAPSNVGGAGQPDVRDNDATLPVSNIPTISYLTGAAGHNNHTLDMGFFSCPTITNPSAAQPLCQGSAGADITVNTDQNAANSIRFVRFTADQSATNGSETAAELAAIYAGTAVATVTPTGGASPYTATLTAAAAGWASAAPGTYYVYAIFNPDPGMACRPVQEIVVNITATPTTANAGTDDNICITTGNVTLAANVPTVGIGTWSVVSGPSTATTQFSSTTTNNATFTPAGGAGVYTLRWTVTNAPCPASTDEVEITFVERPDVSTTNTAICAGGSISLATLVSASGGTLSYHSTLANAQAGTNALSSSTVSPATATNYYIRNTTSAGCFTVKAVTVTFKIPVCGVTTVTKQN